MAKRRKEKEEEYKFKIPEFDEKEFVRKERRNAKVTFISFIFGVFIAIVSQVLWAGMSPSYRWPLIFLLGLSMMSILKYILIKLNIDTSDFGRKEWIGTFFTYFFTWLVALIILVNPPFYDGSAPVADLALIPEMQEPGGNVTIAAYIVDNAGIKSINLSIKEPNGKMVYPDYRQDRNVFVWVYENDNNLTGNFTVTLSVEDINGYKVETNKTFRYSKNVIRLLYPENGTKVNYGTPIRFYFDNGISSEGIFTYYEVNGITVNLTKSGEFYESSPMYHGWRAGENNSIRVFAKVRHCFYDKCINNTVADSSYYIFPAEDDPSIGTRGSPESNAKLPQPHPVSMIPGFGSLLTIIAIITIALFMRRRK